MNESSRQLENLSEEKSSKVLRWVFVLLFLVVPFFVALLAYFPGVLLWGVIVLAAIPVSFFLRRWFPSWGKAFEFSQNLLFWLFFGTLVGGMILLTISHS
jgi:hypothetical protein